MRKILLPLMALVLVIGLALVPAAPASAQQPPPSAIQIEKSEIDGLTEAHVGDTLQYEYAVFIPTGYQSIHSVVVTDDAGTPGDPSDDFNPTYISGDDGDGILEDGETWLYRSDPYTITAQTPDPFQNIVTATGKDEYEGDVEGNSAWSVDILPPGVGGDVQPVNKVGVWAPWLGFILILAIGGSILVLRRRPVH